MMNFVRNIGGSIGIALVGTFVTRTTQIRQSISVSKDAERQSDIPRICSTASTATLRSQGLSAAQATHQAYGRLAMLLQQQASALAYKDVVAMLAVIVACLIPLAFIMQKPAARTGDIPPAH